MAAPPGLLPLRMLNETVYCERLMALEWVHQEWADSGDTVHGRAVHRRVDGGGGKLPAPEGDDAPPSVARSVELSCEELGLIGKIDLVEAADGQVVPVETKRGRAPRDGAWDPERVQVCGQALLLRAHGYTVTRGVLYFAGSRRRVDVEIDDDLVTLTLEARDRAREIAASDALPPPLVDSPKCPRCSLVGICMPDEHNALLGQSATIRPLMPARDDAMPLYVDQPWGKVGKSKREIVVRGEDGEVGRARLDDTSRVVVLGRSHLSTDLLHALAERDIPVCYHTRAGWFVGMFTGPGGRNCVTRIAQHRAAADPDAALRLARAFVVGKINNQRVMLRRNGKPPADALTAMKDHAAQAARAPDLATLLGHEGMAARHYFAAFPTMLNADLGFDMAGRNRRPPRDPVNAMMSFAYAMLVRELTSICHGVGMDPYVGFLHQPRFGRPALALDLMEAFRPIVADSAVLRAINAGEIRRSDVDVHPTGVALTQRGRRALIRVLERRLDDLATHPVLGVRLSYRRILEVQVRLLGKVVLGELDTYPEFTVR